MNDVRQHPSRAELAAFALGRLPQQQAAEVERHVAGCEACCRVLRAVPDDTLVESLRASLQSSETETAGEVPPELRTHPRYRIVKLLGCGGMGTVYQAEHRLMERTVALKVISRELTSNPRAVERFRQEVKAAGQLTHPHIVTFHDAEQEGELHYLVMEYVEGSSLDKLVEQRGPLAVAYACHYARQAALGLQHAHERRMVHRDVKPQNLMVTRQGQVKILDFGLARLAREHGPRKSAPVLALGNDTTPGLTAAGTVMGTPDYIAPEQAYDARHADARSDIYSLGCTLYFLLSGHPPYPGGSSLTKMAAHAGGEPQPLRQVRADLPPELVGLVEKMMAKDPVQRPQTALEVADALAPFTRPTAGAPAPSEPERPRKRAVSRRRFVGIALSAGALSVAGYAVGWLALRNRPSGGHPPDHPFQVLYVLPKWGLWYDDYEPVRRRLAEKGATVVPASFESGWCALLEGSAGRPVWVDVMLSAVRADDYDAVVFAGKSVEPYCFPEKPSCKVARDLISAMRAKNKVIAAICYGQLVLVKAGTLNGRPAAPREEKLFGELARGFPVKWQRGQAVVRDPETNIVTAADSSAAEPFADAILQAMAK
jgi:serine/threonine protein kinase/putative intracellular protease/amidase